MRVTLEWPKERVEELLKLWSEGKSGGEISEIMRLPSRSSAIGKIHRLRKEGVILDRPEKERRTKRETRPRKLTIRLERLPKPKRQRPNNLVAINAVRKSRGPDPMPEPSLELTATCDLMGLHVHACKWPIGDPRDADFGFCGREHDGEGVYCPSHRAIAYRPLDAAAKKDRLARNRVARWAA